MRGQLGYGDSTGEQGILPTGAVECMHTGNGVWHNGRPVGQASAKRVQLRVALPAAEENAPPQSLYLSPDAVPMAGPVRVLMGRYGALENKIPAPADMPSARVTRVQALSLALESGSTTLRRPCSISGRVRECLRQQRNAEPGEGRHAQGARGGGGQARLQLHLFGKPGAADQRPGCVPAGMREADAVVLRQFVQPQRPAACLQMGGAGDQQVAVVGQDLAADIAQVRQHTATKGHIDTLGDPFGLGVAEHEFQANARMRGEKFATPLDPKKSGNPLAPPRVPDRRLRRQRPPGSARPTSTCPLHRRNVRKRRARRRRRRR